MGFNLGKALGGLAGGIVSRVTGGLIKPRIDFNPPTVTRRSITLFPPRYTSERLVGPTVGQGIYTPVGGGGAVNGGGGGGGGGAVMAAACPTGFRANKSTYVTRGGGTSRWPQSLVVHPKGTECVRRRRLNPGNGRAAAHAVRRLVAFYRLSNRVAKQLRKAASRAGLRRGSQRRLPAGRGSAVTVVDTD